MVFSALLLAAAVSVDAFLACFAYGSQNIRIAPRAGLIISLVCSAIFAAALFLGAQIALFVDTRVLDGLSFLILFGVGLVRICDSSLKHWIKRNENLQGQINFSVFNLKFILQVYADPESADIDASRTLSPREAFALAVALSLDGIAVGIGAGLGGVGGMILSVALTFVMTVLAVYLGCKLGTRFARKFRMDLAWLSGGLLILLAVLRLF